MDHGCIQFPVNNTSAHTLLADLVGGRLNMRSRKENTEENLMKTQEVLAALDGRSIAGCFLGQNCSEPGLAVYKYKTITSTFKYVRPCKKHAKDFAHFLSQQDKGSWEKVL
jgi:hypothetical protein